MVDRCSMMNRVVDSPVDSMVGWGIMDSMVDRCSMMNRVVDSMVDSRVGRGMVDKMGSVDNYRGSNLNLDFARDGFNISNRWLLDNSWSGGKVESWGKGRGSRKGCGYWEGYRCCNGGKLGEG